MAHTCDPSSLEAEAGELQVQGQPGLYSETLPQKQIKVKSIHESSIKLQKSLQGNVG
jgi:hypothetical protein